ncbi:MAG: Ger(x)C family spore germination protein [bacterium]
MKKIIILVLFTFSMFGCTDYKELNTLSYITGMGFDYIDDMYIVTYEVMDNKKDAQSVVTNTYIITGTGKTTYEAHLDAASKLNKTAYYLHSQVIILTDNIVDDKLFDIVDAIIRNPKLNEESLLVITNDNTPEEIFNSTTEAWPSASFYIYNLIMDNDYSQNYFIKMPFAVFTEKLNTQNVDPVVSVIKTEDNKIVLDGALTFKLDNKSGVITKEESNLYNTFEDENNTIPFVVKHEDETIEVATKVAFSSFSVTNNKISIELEILSEIKKSNTNINLFDDSIYEEIASKISLEFEELLTTFIKDLQDYESDIFGFANYYYINSREVDEDIWIDNEIEINITSTISRKGIIYNVG